MPTHTVKESIKAFFDGHIDSGKHTQIKEAKEDIDSKVDQILKLSRDKESDGKDENSLPNTQTEPLIDLIKEFRDQYHTLYSHYDDIIVELGKKAHGKHDKDNSSSSSSSSDSEPEHSSKERGKKNGRLTDSSKLELGTAHQEVDELREKLTTTYEENKVLRSRLQEVENALAERDVELSDLERKFEEEMNKASQEITTLKEELASTTGDHQRALEEKESVKALVTDLELQADSLVTERRELGYQLAKLTEECRKHVEEKNDLTEQICQVKYELTERDSELSDSQKKLDEIMNKASQQITALTSELENLKIQFDSLQAQKTELEMKAKNEKQAFSQDLQMAKEKIAGLTDTIKNLEFAVNEKDTALGKLKEEYKQIEGLLEESQGNHQVLERKMEETVGGLRRVIESKDRAIVDLEKQVDALKEDLDTKVDELGSLTDFIRNIEVRLRLRNQKLRVTEQLLTEKEEIHKTTMQKLNSEIKFLQDRVATLSAAVSAKDEASRKVVSNVSDMVQNTLIGVESVIISFKEKYHKHMDCVSLVSAELKAVKDWVAAANNEKSQMEEKLRTIVQQLQDTSARELTLTDTVSRLEAKMRMEESEKEKLTAMAKQLKQNVTEYEQLTKVQEGGINFLAEEKREAIKQLCIWIDYHRERCDYFKEKISKMRPVSGAPRRT
ncbi:hypothetical protein QQ045_019617 [Rhodiola kirilowii]